MKTEKRKVEESAGIRGAVGRLGFMHPSGTMLIVHAQVVTDVSQEKIYETWSQVDSWSRWAKPWISSARWLEKRDWEVGAKLELIRHFGLPVGKQMSVETIREVNPGASVAWWDGKGAMRSCLIWFFEALPDGTTKVQVTEVFVGPVAFIAKIFWCRGRWSAMYEHALQNLVRVARTS